MSKGLLAGLMSQIYFVEEVQEMFLKAVRDSRYTSNITFCYLSTTLLAMSNWCKEQEKSGRYQTLNNAEQEYIINKTAAFVNDMKEAAEKAEISWKRDQE